MRARDAAEEHRASTPLEAFFDLCFVVAVAVAGQGLHHAIAEGHALHGIAGYGMVFFGIWWAWMNVTWFASAYDVDDVPYRLAVFVQIVGVLVIAAGVPRALAGWDFTVITLGYAIMRVALVAQWVRAGRSDPACRATAYRYAIGVSACMIGWGLCLLLPAAIRPVTIVLVAAELAVPVWAERTGTTAWHPGHIAERYNLFTLIVLGESVFAATVAIQAALDDEGTVRQLAQLIVGAPLIVFAMWWIYFSTSAERLLASSRVAFVWGYGHLLIFGSAAAVGAGLALGVDVATHTGHASATAAGLAVCVPAAVYTLTVWALHLRRHHLDHVHTWLFPGASLLVLGSAFSPAPVLLAGIWLVLLVALGLATARTEPA
jgi:low temperature requirement protein LtrA